MLRYSLSYRPRSTLLVVSSIATAAAAAAAAAAAVAGLIEMSVDVRGLLITAVGRIEFDNNILRGYVDYLQGYPGTWSCRPRSTLFAVSSTAAAAAAAAAAGGLLEIFVVRDDPSGLHASRTSFCHWFDDDDDDDDNLL